MARLVRRQLPVVVIISIAVLSVASAASAATAPFGCRASGLRVTVGAVVEPTVANAGTYPCHTASAGVSTLNVPTAGTGTTGTTSGGAEGTGQTSNQVTAGPVGAFTYATGSAQGTTAPGAAAVASVQGLTIPTTSGLISVVGPVQADAQYACVNDQVVGSAQSTLDILYVNGQRTTLPSPGASTTIQLGGGAYIAVNEKITTANSLEERVLDIHLSNSVNIVVGEAEVTSVGSKPCAGTEGVPPTLEICPPGSTLNVVAQFCEIVLPGQTIIVSRPFQGPSGGTVVALSVARKEYHSRCLYGPGPKYAVIAKMVGAHVIGTHLADRILGLAIKQRIAGLGGNDCIDDSAGQSHIFDGRGNDTIIVGPGGNRVADGNGHDLIIGGTGPDVITAGNGPDRIFGNGGNDRINSGLGEDHDFGGPGKNRIFTLSGTAKVDCGSGRDNTAFVRHKAIAFARKHGCQVIHHLK